MQNTIKTNFPKLMNGLVEAIAHDATEIPNVIESIKGGLELFMEREKKKRDIAAYHAVENLAVLRHVKTDKNMKFFFLVDAAFYLFPNGTAGGSPGIRKFFEEFLEICRLKDQSDYFADKDENMRDWWENQVKPLISTDLS